MLEDRSRVDGALARREPRQERRQWSLAGLCLVVALGLSAPAEAQHPTLLVGLTRSSLASDGVSGVPGIVPPEVSRSGGAYFAVSLGTDPARRASVAVEGTYLVRGVKLSTSGSSTINRVSYLAAPIVGRLGVGRIGPVGLHVLGGPTVGLRLTAHRELTNVGLGDRVGRFDTGVLTGLGAQIRAITVQGRYEWGLRNMARNGGLLGTGTMKNRTFALLALLPLGG